ncbi:hypothetical protein [Roseateles sp. P5_E7]
MRIVFASRFFLRCAFTLARARWRLGRWTLGAWLMGMASMASQAQDEAAQVRQWREKLAAHQAFMDGHNGMSALPAHRTLAEIQGARYESENDRAFDMLDVKLMNQLGRDLAAILRVPAPPGFKNEPLLNIDSLRPYIVPFPPLHSLSYPPIDGDGAAFVTHKLLLEDWMHSKYTRFDTVQAALDSDVLYGAVFQQWTGIRVAARLPILVPPGSSDAAALLMTPTMDIADSAPPTDIVVALIQSSHVVISRMPLKLQLPSSPSCVAGAKRLDARRHYVEAKRSFRACYSKTFAERPELKEATQQAQAFLGRLRSAFDAD